jgi:hypothetical protein
VKKTHIPIYILLLLLLSSGAVRSQNSPNCITFTDDDYLTGQVFFNYGGVEGSFNQEQLRLNATAGQMVIGSAINQQYTLSAGFWSTFLLPPSAPVVLASEGDLDDRIQIDWTPDPLSPAATAYKIYRNGSLLASVDGETFSFIDFNVLAGRFYTYEVAGVNTFGEGSRGNSLGFLNPNGSITGQVKTFSNNAVAGAVVRLEPTFGAAVSFDGNSMAFSEYSPVFPTSEFTLSCWVKLDNVNNGTAIFDFGSISRQNWWLHTLPAAAGKGIRFGIGRGAGQSTTMDYTFPAGTADQWHYIAATYNGSSVLLYVDGELIGTAVTTISRGTGPLFLGQKSDGSGRYVGKLDELRFFNRQLPQTELQMLMNQTTHAETPGLVSYWKFDEGVGSKAFNISVNKIKMYFCGAAWTSDKPAVVNAGVTDETGFYKIEGVNYGAGATFTAKASKNFYFNQSLEFNAANKDYADLTGFKLTDTASLTVTFKAFDFSGKQVILSQNDASGNPLILRLNSGVLELLINGTTESLGSIGMGFHHLALTMISNGSSLYIKTYLDGTFLNQKTFSASNWAVSNGIWKLGARAVGSSHADYFTGLVDEVAFFKGALTLPDIQAYAGTGTDEASPNLRVYFNLNEGSGEFVKDMGTELTGSGTLHGALWSTVASISNVLPHEFTPVSRLVSLNPSNTSTDQVDFTDQSTIPVSGYVRFENTNCFQKRVEILVNGKSNIPQIYTDEEGRFSVDFEPGATVKLSPRYEDHTFYPAFWEIEDISTPVSGILFRNQTKRTVSGQMAGNATCRKSVIPDGSIVKVKVATLNGCFEKIIQLENPNGKFNFTGIPPDSVTVSVVEHSNPVIYTYFQNKGGFTVDLRTQNDTVDFIYLAPPVVEMSPLTTNLCGLPMLSQAGTEQTTVKVYESYHGGSCYLDSAMLTINNDIADLSQFDTLMTGGQFKYKFKAGGPNIVSPYLKTLQVTAEVHDEQATATLNTVVLGRRPRQATFATTSPSIPTLILRDPPGDASYSFIEKGSTTCQAWSYSASYGDNQDIEATLSLGADLTTSVGLGAEVELEVEATADFTVASTTTYNNLTTNESETCFTTTQVISTGDNDLVVGSSMGGDVYMGGAINYIFGITDELVWDSTNCSYYLDKGLFVFPDGFATTFIYSEYQIENVVIPNLITIGDQKSADRWQEIIDLNKKLKNEAVFSQNLSFDAGLVYEESESTELTKSVTNEWTVEFSSAFIQEYGIEVNGIGLGGGITMGITSSESSSTTNTETQFRTVGFALADDDIGDNFTVNVKKDRAYGTPVFDLVSGQSQCPHEPNTQAREGVYFSADKQVAVNVPMNDVAVFKLFLGNTSQSEETKLYTLEALQENNPDGAIIRFNGLASLNVGVPFGESVEVTMTVARGPVAFTYENLRVGYFSDCEVERADALGIDPDDEFYKELEFDVFFLEPCSMVSTTFPLQDWVLLPANGNILNITVAEYDINDTDLELMRVQYRRSQGDGAWINIAEIQKADLGPVFTIVPWNTQGLQDGLYEIRTVSQCFGAQNPGISKVVKGKIERTAPEILGTPEPADGVLAAGDEISIQFNEPIRCGQLIQADFFNNNNVGLYNTETGELIDAVITCSGDKIVIVPNVPNKFIENKVLRVEVDNIQDLAGNLFVHKSWEFFVDRNPMRWSGGNVKVNKYAEDVVSVTRQLVNTGGQALSYELSGVPDWVSVGPLNGIVAPGAYEDISFVFDNNLSFGIYSDTIFAITPLGNEPMPVRCRVMCRPPEWTFDPAQYSGSMNFTLKLDIEGTLSTDEDDIIAAFIDGELRGLGSVQLLPTLPPAGTQYRVFLTIFGNPEDDGKPIVLEIWDASSCLRFVDLIETFEFGIDNIVGTIGNPTVLHTNSLIRRDIPLSTGWNWLSFNLVYPDPSLDMAFASLDHPENDLIKSQTAFAEYFGGNWLGSLPAVDYSHLFQYRADQPDTIRTSGAPVDPAGVNIPISEGWNWIGYVPNYPLPVSTALKSLTPLNGDIIKGQTSFAQYVAGFGWLGSLKYMEPPRGYQLKIGIPGTLTYPKPAGAMAEVSERGPELPNFWTVDPTQYEYSMTLVGMLAQGGINTTLAGHEIGVFVGNELRGSAKAIYLEQLNMHLFFLTMYANTAGELLHFKLYDAATGQVTNLTETMYFTAGQHQGSVQSPVPFGYQSTTATVEPVSGQSLQIAPNPFTDGTTIRFALTHAQRARVLITDMAGRIVLDERMSGSAGTNALLWNAKDAPSGVYFVKLETEEGTEVKKVIRN